MNYLPTPIFVSTESLEYAAHWDVCINSKQPHIVIRPEGGAKGKYAKIEYDLLPCKRIGLQLDAELMDSLLQVYKAYCNFYRLPPDKKEAIGGSVALSFRVFREHAEAVCTQLFQYLQAFINEQLLTIKNIYPEAMEEIPNGGQGLRFVLDPLSAEFEFATDEQRMDMMLVLANSGYPLANVISGYLTSYQASKPHVAAAVREGLLYNISLWQRTYPREEEYDAEMLGQMGDKELVEILLDKILGMTIY